MERNKSAKRKNSAEKSSGEILPRDTEGNLMKSVAQTIIEADRFYTIAAKTGSVIQAVESVKDGGNIRLGKYERKPEQEWAFVREGDGVYRIRNRASGKLIDLMMTGTLMTSSLALLPRHKAAAPFSPLSAVYLRL